DNATSLLTFLLVFLLQSSQNRDTTMLKIKLNELIRANHIAKNFTIDLETLSDEQLTKLEKFYSELSEKNDDVPELKVNKD
ncbi:MAG: low affinity iron permease family protein, partial [Pseudomonadota bacterium]|nr:low affinity iron permease family protein [Pseudomonadota bacterium]